MLQCRRDSRGRIHLPGQHSSRGILRGFGFDLLALLLYLRPDLPGGGSEDGESLHAVLHSLGASKKLS